MLAIVYLLLGATTLSTGAGLAFGLGAGLMVGGSLLMAVGVLEVRGTPAATGRGA